MIRWYYLDNTCGSCDRYPCICDPSNPYKEVTIGN